MIKKRKTKTPRQKQIDRMDVMCSEIVRRRAIARCGGCEHCLRAKTIGKLQCSHFIGRTNLHTRFDLDNLSGIDGHCHMDLEHNPLTHKAWMDKHVGTEIVEELRIKSNLTDKVNLDEIEAFLKESLERWRSYEA